MQGLVSLTMRAVLIGIAFLVGRGIAWTGWRIIFIPLAYASDA